MMTVVGRTALEVMDDAGYSFTFSCIHEHVYIKIYLESLSIKEHGRITYFSEKTMENLNILTYYQHSATLLSLFLQVQLDSQ